MPTHGAGSSTRMGPPPVPEHLDGLPPSSIAAIVQNLSKASGSPARLSGRDDFQQLLAEILGPNDAENSDAGALEENIALNYRLIQIVTTAGLSVLLQDDPFAAQEELVSQAANSLLVIRKAINRNPQVLFCPPPIGNDLKEAEQTYLFLWLLPRIVPLLGRPRDEALRDDLLKTLQCIFIATTKIPEAWRYASDLLLYFRSCFMSIVGAFRSTATYSSSVSKNFRLELPGEGFVVQHDTVMNNVQSNTHILKFSVNSLGQAGFIAIHLYSALSSLNSFSHLPGMKTASDNTMCMINGMSTLWDSISAWESLPTLQNDVSPLRVRILEVLCKTVEDLDSVDSKAFILGCTAVLGLKCIMSILHAEAEKIPQTMEPVLASFILTLLKVAENFGTLSYMLKRQSYPIANNLIEDSRTRDVLTTDSQMALAALVSIYAQEPKTAEKVNSFLRSESGGKWAFKDSLLQIKADRLELPEVSDDSEIDGRAARPHKRPRLTTDASPRKSETEGINVTAMISETYKLLGSQEAPDLAGLHMVASNGFKKLPEAERYVPYRNLGLLACALSGTLQQQEHDSRPHENWGPYFCSFCDSIEIQNPSDRKVTDSANAYELFTTFENMLKLDEFRESPNARIWAMMSLRRMLNHTDELEYLNVEVFPLGQWCMQTMNSSRRELRIAASRTLPSFLSFPYDERILKLNRYTCVAFLKALSETEDNVLLETCVVGWGHVGRMLLDQELNLALIALVQFLGHSNSFIVGVAYNEIQALATAHKESPRRLFTPFWRSISPSVVKQLQTRPQITQLLSELCGLEVSDFLVLTQAYTLPYLVLSRRTEIIERIAQASGNITARALCVTKANMTAILAVLLTQDIENVEKATISLLQTVSPEFAKISFAELIRSDPILLAEELIKMAGDEDEVKNDAKKNRIIDALRLVAFTHRKIGSSKKEKKIDTLGVFFENNVLGIMAQFSDTIHDVRGRSTPLEKIRCLRGIGEMTKLVQGCVSSALPQIFACLQSAMKLDILRRNAFSAWAYVMCELPEEDIIPLVGQTFSVLLQYWEQLQDETKDQARGMVSTLFERYPKQLEENVSSIPSLGPITLLAKQEAKLRAWKDKRSVRERFMDFATRCCNENGAVVEQALIELSTFLQEEQSFIHTSAASEQPDVVISEIMRCLLDACVQYKDTDAIISRLAAECLGMIGAVDPSRVEAPRASKQIIVLQNFESADESLSFLTELLEQRLVKAFLAATDTKAQGFLAYAMQELLKFCQFDANVVINRRSTQAPAARKWREFSETARSILTPYLTSKYVLTGNPPIALAPSYPIYTPSHNYRSWLQTFLFDLMAKVRGDNATAIFSICSRIIKGQDISIPSFILPYVTLNVVLCGTDKDREAISKELLAIVEQSEGPRDPLESETLRECSETVFLLVDYLSKWLKEKKQHNSNLRIQAARSANRHVRPDDDEADDAAISNVEKVLSVIPADIMGIRSFECKSYPRALFYWEQHIRQARERLGENEMKPLYEKLQNIYAQIDEPDGIEGISAHLKIYTIEQQIIEHRNAGRWTAAQSWYELQLGQTPNDTELQIDLLTCLKESGQYDNLISHADKIITGTAYKSNRIVDIAVEASWLSERWGYLEKFLNTSVNPKESSYDIDLGRALSALRAQDTDAFKRAIMACRQDVIRGLSHSGTGTLGQCHTSSLKLHALSELELISDASHQNIFNDPEKKGSLVARLQRRLDILGSSAKDKEYILAIRRTAYRLMNTEKVNHELGLTWLATARLARKAGRVQQAFNAILHSSKLGEQDATVEHARLLWHEGQHRKAIQSLQGVIDANILGPTGSFAATNTEIDASMSRDRGKIAPVVPQNLPLAKANLLLAKWLDTAGHLHSTDMTAQYQKASITFLRWEQGYYYLGRHYNNLHESFKNLPPAQQPQLFLNGETTKLICQCYIRSLPWGTKYIFQTLPRFLTLWLDLGEPHKLLPEHGSEHFRNDISNSREKNLAYLHTNLLPKYVDKIQPYMWYTVLPQILSRICHPHAVVHQHLEEIIVRVVSAHPQQALWSLMAVIKSTQKDRSSRGSRILGLITAAHAKLTKQERKSSAAKTSDRADIRIMITQAQRLTEQLLHLSNAELPGKPAAISLRNDLHFNHSVAPCPLVLPVQAVLSVTLPSNPAMIRSHMPFGHDQPTIHSFSDDADVMSSLQKPRKITVTASNGRMYNFLCKPKDDLRKDARLMEFAAMINRLLKKDPEAIQRRLHIRTYHVTPLNEECGLIEWVPNVRPFRDILFKQYKKRGITVNFNETRHLMNEACAAPANVRIFTDVILPRYPPVLHEWFVDHFPDPAMWLSSRTGYARTSAVWSMVGNVLGLGDRHGENILLDETNGDTAHVDFNCLFDKGLTFDKPEMVPFRLTNNMVDGFGVSGYEGPFRRSCEVVTRILRMNEDTLMTVLEAFLYDPAVDMVVRRTKKVTGIGAKAPDNPKDVLEGIRTKIQGKFPGESVPLSVEGQVQELIRKAVSPENLSKMYIGWMSFF